MFTDSRQSKQKPITLTTATLILKIFCTYLLFSLENVKSQALLGAPCTTNPCIYSDMCIANAPGGAGIVCRCRLTHMFPNSTYKTNYTACTQDYGPFGTFPTENNLQVPNPFFEYERLPDDAFSADGNYQDFLPHYARIHTNENGKGAWCALLDNNPHYLQLYLGGKNKITAVGTQARAGVSVVLGVKNFKVSISDDNTTFNVIQESGSDRLFTGNTDKASEVINYFHPPIEATFIRFIPKEFISMRCMRVEIYGLKLVDECTNGWNQCDAKAACTDTLSSYLCTCPVGYYDILGNGFLCLQVNECRNRRPEFRHNCSQYADCEDTDGGFNCDCFKGYLGDGYYCEDIIECLTGNYTCHQNAHCVNIAGSYECKCNAGYTGDGSTKCEDENECKKDHDCHKEARCENTVGSYKCSCRRGFKGNGKMCEDQNECSFDIPMCHESAKCTNTIGSYSCQCVEGFVGSGRWCEDINECDQVGTPRCTSDERCYNYPGGYVCTCPAIMPIQRPYKRVERDILEDILSNFRDTSLEDWKYPLDYHAHMIRTIYELVLRTYKYHFKEVPHSFFMTKVAGNNFAVELYDFRCTDIANVSFPNFCHDGYQPTELRWFTDVVEMWLIEKAVEPFENWATPPPPVAPNPFAPTTTQMPLLSDGPLTTQVVLVNGVNVTLTEAPRTSPTPFRECGGKLTGVGFFQTPNFPYNYPPNAKCVWEIEAPESHSVYVRFHFFKLESDRKCFYDYVEIHDETENGPVLARYCGEQYTTPIKSGKRKLFVIFYSDLYYEFKGFRAEYNILAPRVSLTCITYNQMSTMPSSFKRTWEYIIDKESDKSSYVPVSRLLACKQYPRCNHTRPSDVIFTLEHFRTDRNVKICVHWILDEIGTTWTTRPCRLVKTNKTHTVCSCHTWGIVGILGKFEIWHPERKIPLFALGWNSILSVLLVAIALAGTFLYLLLKDQWGAVIMEVLTRKEFDSGRIIQMHIVLSTLLTEITFSIITFNIVPTKNVCFFMAFVFYYLLQTVFFWLFIYAIFLQSRVKEIFDSEKYNSYKIYLFVGYGLPFVVTLTMSGLDFKSVIDEGVCWLLFQGSTVWGFSGVIITLGIGCLTLLSTIIYNARDMENGVILQEKCMRTIFTTFFFLLTVVFGASALQERSFFAEYVFSLCNLLQGYSIAIMYCVLRREDPIIKANQVGPIPDFGSDDEGKYNNNEEDGEENKDMESDRYDSDEEMEEVENNKENEGNEDDEKENVSKYLHIKDGSVIFLRLRGTKGDDELHDLGMQETDVDNQFPHASVDEHSSGELKQRQPILQVAEEKRNQSDPGDDDDEDSDQEIMFRFDELRQT